MNVLIKKLQSQESGYSGDKPGQRGKYILIPQKAYELFPDMSAARRNSFRTIRLKYDPSGGWIGAYYVWHNTAFFPELQMKRAYNERRIYRNDTLDYSLSLDRGAIVLFAPTDDERLDICAVSLTQSDPEYRLVESLLSGETNKLTSLNALRSAAPVKTAHLKLLIDTSYREATNQGPSVVNTSEIIKEGNTHLASQSADPTAHDDPLLALGVSFKTQTDFSTAVREVYNNRCAIRESYVYKDHPIGLDAAHIRAKADAGNFLPSNGILLSTDFHRAFDEGLWTLTDDLKVQVHDDVSDGLLRDFHGKRIAVPKENIAFAPYAGYVKWHQENTFGFFRRLSDV